MNMDKKVGLRFGTAKPTSPPEKHSETIKWYRYGIDKLPPEHKYIGIAPGTPSHVASQWKDKLDKLEAELPRTVFGRSLWIKNYFAAKVWYTFRFQKPLTKEHAFLLARLQK